MPESYSFPMFSGLLEPKHYKQIGPALWLFLWCVSSTTKEVEREGTTWGIVLGNKPVKVAEIAETFSINEKTVRRWIDDLEKFEYLKVTRSPVGLILTVRNSKKFTDKNVRSLSGERTKMSDHPPDDRTKMSDHTDKNVRSNKDITVVQDLAVVDEAINNENEIFVKTKSIADYFVKKRGFGVDVSPDDFREIGKVVADGIPLSIVKDVIDKSFEEYKPKHKHDKIRHFVYCLPRCYDEWTKVQSGAPITYSAVPHVETVALGNPIRLSYQEKRNLTAKQKIKEAEERERIRESSQEIVLCHPE